MRRHRLWLPGLSLGSTTIRSVVESSLVSPGNTGPHHALHYSRYFFTFVRLIGKISLSTLYRSSSNSNLKYCYVVT